MKKYLNGRRPKTLGISLAEYVLLGALIGILAIGAFLTFGQALERLMLALRTDMSDKISSSEAYAATVASKPNAGKSLSLTLSSGNQINLGYMPTNLSNSVATTGANGATQTLLNNLDLLIARLQASGTADPEHLNQLQALANKGHEMAAIQYLIEQAAANASNTQEFASTKITYNGETMSAFWWAQRFSFYAAEGSAKLMADPLNPDYNGSRGPKQKEFVDLYLAALNGGALSDPAVNQVVTGLAADIARIAGTMENTMDTFVSHNNETKEWTFTNKDPATFQDAMASHLTNTDAAGICAVGGGQSTGTQAHFTCN